MSRRCRSSALSCAALAVAVMLVAAACGCSSSSSPGGALSSSSQAQGRAWAVGNLGTILATTDGGTHWTTQTPETRGHLLGVSFADSTHGWTVGGAAVEATDMVYGAAFIRATTDGGTHWVSQKAPAVGFLRSVACVDATHVWAAGADKTAAIVASSDGGQTWVTEYADSKVAPIADIAFADDSHGTAVSLSGDVLRTTDGGAHWSVQTELQGSDFDWRIAFGDPSHGWIVGTDLRQPDSQAPGRVWATGDGGATWEPAPAPQRYVAGLDAVTATDASHVWIASYAGGIFRSTNGGLDWIASTKSLASATAVTFGDSTHGWAIMCEESTSIVATTDGGVSWHAQTRPGQFMTSPPAGTIGNPEQLMDIACPQ